MYANVRDTTTERTTEVTGKKLTAREALDHSSPPPGRYADGRNLYLEVAKGGSKSWLFGYERQGVRSWEGFGSATGDGKARVTHRQARQKADIWLGALAAGRTRRRRIAGPR